VSIEDFHHDLVVSWASDTSNLALCSPQRVHSGSETFVEVDGGCGDPRTQDFIRCVWYIGSGSGLGDGLGGCDSNKSVVDLSRASTGHFVVPTCRVSGTSGVFRSSIGPMKRTRDTHCFICFWFFGFYEDGKQDT